MAFWDKVKNFFSNIFKSQDKTEKTLRTLDKTFTAGASEIGIPAEKIKQGLTYAGVSYSEPMFSLDIEGLSTLKENTKYFKKLKPNEPIPESIMTYSPLNKHRKYRVYGKVIGKDLTTGEKIEKNISFYDNELYTKKDYQDMLENAEIFSEEYLSQIWDKIDIIGVEKNINIDIHEI